MMLLAYHITWHEMFGRYGRFVNRANPTAEEAVVSKS